MNALRQTVSKLPGFDDYHVVAEGPAHAEAIEALVDLDFGPERFRKTAYRFRDGIDPVDGLGFVAMEDEFLVGTIRFWQVDIAGQPALLLGPLAIQPNRQGRGIGHALMHKGLSEARAQGWKSVILVGDEPYYSRFGFSRALAEPLSLPGPVNLERFLALELVPGALSNVSGMVKPVQAAPVLSTLRSA